MNITVMGKLEEWVSRLGRSTGVSSSLRLQTVSRGWPKGRIVTGFACL